MPKLTDEMIQHNTQNFGYSAIKMEKLVENDYTLVGIAVDTTGSVSLFADDLLNALKTSIESCKKAPRSENLLARVTEFNSLVDIKELHGFKELSAINVGDYKTFQPYGTTNLFDATADMINSLADYGEQLSKQRYLVNAVGYIITDGDDNNSKKASPSSIANLLQNTKVAEYLESIQIILIGVNTGQASAYLSEFKKDAELDQFIDVKDATKGSLAKLASFVSRSVSSTSQALGSGQSVQLTF